MAQLALFDADAPRLVSSAVPTAIPLAPAAEATEGAARPLSPPPASPARPRYGNPLPPVQGLDEEEQHLLDALGGLVGHEYVITLQHPDQARRIAEAVRRALRNDFARRVGEPEKPAAAPTTLAADLDAAMRGEEPPAPPPARHAVPALAALSAEIAGNMEMAVRQMRSLEADFAGDGEEPWAVFLSPPDRAGPPLLLSAAGRWDAEYQASRGTGVAEPECFAVPMALLPEGLAVPLATHPLRLATPKAGDLGDAFTSAMEREMRRSDEGLAATKRATAKLLRMTVPELDAMVEGQREERQEAEAKKKAAKAAKPSAKGARGKEVRGVDGVTQRQLSGRQIELVQGLRVEHELVLAPEGHIPDWPALKIVVETLGGLWVPGGKKAGGGKRGGYWRFPDDIDPREVLRVALATGHILDPKSNDLYETPDAMADDLVAMADLQSGMRVLEPSAGRGALVRALRRRCPDVQIVCVELLPGNVEALELLGCRVFRQDFLTLQPHEVAEPFDRVVMNPPFSKLADVAHITHALRFLRPGGRIAAIASAGLMERETASVAELRCRLNNDGATWRKLEGGAFASSGTMIRSCMVAATVP